MLMKSTMQTDYGLLPLPVTVRIEIGAYALKFWLWGDQMNLGKCDGAYPLSLENFSRYVSYKDLDIFVGQEFSMDNPVMGRAVFWEHYPDQKVNYHLEALENGNVALQ